MERIELADLVAEVAERFRFLIDQYGMTGPEASDELLPSVFYRGPGLLIGIFLNQGDGAGRRISVIVSMRDGDGAIKAELPGLVEAAAFAPAHHVGWKAHTAVAMRRTLEDNATWLSRLMPALSGPEGPSLAGNAARQPKGQRPAGAKWRYASHQRPDRRRTRLPGMPPPAHR